MLSASAGGRTIEILDGSLRFEGFDRGRGRVVQRGTTRVTDEGRAPVETVSETEARYERRGDTVHAARANGTSETYVLQDAGRRLRTVASSGCAAPPGAMCIGVLRILVFERMP